MNQPQSVAITGASGLVGAALAASLTADGVRVVRLVRGEPNRAAGEAAWRPDDEWVEPGALDGVDAVVHLAGKGIAEERWSDRVKRAIVESRVRGTTAIARAVASAGAKPRVLVSASAIGFYGDRPGETVDEQSPPGSGFLADTCQQWEGACRPAWEAGVRVVQSRLGIVLSPDGGALAKMLPVFRSGLGGALGSGRQVMSWVALPDVVAALRFAIATESLHGAANVTAPRPVTNRDFTETLARVLGWTTFVATPAFALRLAMGEMAGPLLLEGADVRPRRLVEQGFVFQLPELEGALRRLLGR